MNIKLIALILFSFTWNQQLYSQCKLIKNKDDFSSKVLIMTEDVEIANVFPILKSGDPWTLSVSLYLNDSTIGLILTHQSATNFDYINEVYFKLDNGIVITKTNRVTQKLYHQGVYYTCYSTFFLSKDELINLSKNKVVKYKVVFSNFPEFPVYEKDLKDKKSLSLKEWSSCLLAEVK